MSSNNEPSATENNDDSSHPVSMDADTDVTSTTVPILSSERDEIEATNSSVPQAQPKSNEPISNINNKPQEGSSSVSRKKSRLQWDEENLTSNAAEMVRAGPRMKIDEPKTPYAAGGSSASENGSSASDSAHQSPPESPAFIPRERLVGFNALEQQEKGQAPAASSRNTNHNTTSSSGARHRSNSTGSNSGGGNVSDGASSVGSGGRSVHISDDNLGTSAGSSPRSKELFAMRRRAHYRNEARVFEWIRRSESDEDDDDDGEDDNNNDTSNENENENENDNDNTNVASEVARRVTDRLEENNEDDSNMPNGQKENVDQDTNGHVKESHQQS